MSNNSLSFSKSVPLFTCLFPMSLPWAADLNYHYWQTSPLFSNDFFLPASVEEKRAANHLPPLLIASWLHSLFWFKVQLLHGWFLPHNCRTASCSSIFCVRGVTNQEETSDTVWHCLWSKSLLEVLYMWALVDLISMLVGWGAVVYGIIAYALPSNLQKWFAV